ncbi:hypothetical protein EYF80_052072 [Liparis tanakae]|uniref:Uncharacterized protein n=1 Tax=Liparis tanakae TaxID=230148 RepID=A0A4Z2FA63_9TELE|nr:hypothetical protein EYF80_052072 [Liparis tanakae]
MCSKVKGQTTVLGYNSRIHMLIITISHYVEEEEEEEKKHTNHEAGLIIRKKKTCFLKSVKDYANSMHRPNNVEGD